MRAGTQGGGFQVSSSLILPRPVSEVYDVFNNRVLPSSSGEQPRTMAILLRCHGWSFPVMSGRHCLVASVLVLFLLNLSIPFSMVWLSPYHILFIQSLVGGLFGCFQFLVTVNTVMSIWPHSFVWTSASEFLGVELLGHKTIPFTS